MYKRAYKAKLVITTLVAALLFTACATVTTVSEVAGDRLGYLSKRFSPQSLSPDIATKIPRDSGGKNYQKLVVTSEVNASYSDGKKESLITKETFVGVENGLIQRVVEMSRNDIAYSLTFSLTYKGMIPLKWQIVPLSAINAGMLSEVKSITRFDAMPVALGSESIIDYSTGSEKQIGSNLASQTLCKVSQVIAASEVHHSLAGSAREIKCQLSVNNAVQYHSKWIFIDQYNVAIQTEYTDSNKKTTIHIIDIKT